MTAAFSLPISYSHTLSSSNTATSGHTSRSLSAALGDSSFCDPSFSDSNISRSTLTSSTVPGERGPPADQNIFSGLLEKALGPDQPLISPQTIEGGKRFWGQLMRTVAAAGGGNVPLDVGIAGEVYSYGAGIDM